MEFELSENERTLLRLLPQIRRARDFRLYLAGGKRLVDLWLCGGRAILGHKPPGVLRELKNTAERGLFVPLPGVTEARFIKALAALFPSLEGKPRYNFRIYCNGAALVRALEKAGFTVDAAFLDPAFPSRNKKEKPAVTSIPLWRPFLDKVIEAPFFVPVLPWPLSPHVLVFDESIDNSAAEKLPPGDIIPPVLLVPAARAIHDLAAVQSERNKIKYSRIEKALALPECVWKKKGVYLSRINQDFNWRKLWGRFLEKGFLLPPSSREPIIIPPDLSPGEEAGLAALLVEKGSS